MKKGIYFFIGIVTVIIVSVLIYFYMNNRNVITSTEDFVYMEGNFSNNFKDNVFINYNDYYDAFHSDSLKESDFKENNYVALALNYDSCAERDVKPTGYIINGNDITVDVEYTASCGVCAPITTYYLLKVNKDITSANVKFNYKAVNKPDCDSNISYKPLIYLYPNEETNVTVKLGYPDRLTVTYPNYDNEWNVVAKPNGELVDKKGRTFYGLYWEGINYISDNFEDGFVVSGENTSEFLEEKLSILGLNERESNEFIIYWLPKLKENKYNLIRFESIDNVNKQMPLEINPTPDTIIRVFMEYKALDTKVEIKEQNLPSISRKGFTVVEWGGSLIK